MLPVLAHTLSVAQLTGAWCLDKLARLGVVFFSANCSDWFTPLCVYVALSILFLLPKLGPTAATETFPYSRSKAQLGNQNTATLNTFITRRA